MKLTPLVLVLIALPCVACSSSGAPADPAVGDDDANLIAGTSKTFTFRCTEDTAREAKWEKNSFASLVLTLKGKTATLTSIVYTTTFVTTNTQDLASTQASLASGLSWDGKTPMTAKEKADQTDHVDQAQKVLAANGSLAFEGEIKPYVRQPKQPTVQYPLAPTTAGIYPDTLWSALGNEGTGARLLLPPEMLNGNPAKPDIEFEGNQGPLWDRLDCK